MKKSEVYTNLKKYYKKIGRPYVKKDEEIFYTEKSLVCPGCKKCNVYHLHRNEDDEVYIQCAHCLGMTEPREGIGSNEENFAHCFKEFEEIAETLKEKAKVVKNEVIYEQDDIERTYTMISSLAAKQLLEQAGERAAKYKTSLKGALDYIAKNVCVNCEIHENLNSKNWGEFSKQVMAQSNRAITSNGRITNIGPSGSRADGGGRRR